MSGFVQALKTIVFRVIITGVIIIVLGVLLNWGFMLWFGRALRTFDWVGGVDIVIALFLTLLLLFVLPMVYIWSIKAGLLLTALGSFRGSYRDRIAQAVIDQVAPKVVGSAQTGVSVAQQMHDGIAAWKSSLPFGIRVVINTLLDKIPLLKGLIDAAESLDRSAFTDEAAFRQSMHTAMQPYLEKTSVSGTGGWGLLLGVLVVNILLLLGLYFVLV